MTNLLAILQGNKLQLTELEQLIMAESAQEEAAYDPIPTRIKISPGGVNVFATNDGDTFKVLKGIIAISQKARAYWPEKGTGQPPMCASPDGSHGIVAPDITDNLYRAAITTKEPHPAIRLLDADKPIPPHFDCASRCGGSSSLRMAKHNPPSSRCRPRPSKTLTPTPAPSRATGRHIGQSALRSP
jgi:hypothetical protein